MKHRLSPDTRQELDALIDELIHENGEVGTGQIQAKTFRHIVMMAERGDSWADDVMESLVFDGLASHVKRRLKADRARITISHTGEVINLPTRFGVRKHDEIGEPEKAYQQPLWWELTWGEFERLIGSLRNQQARLGFEVTALSEVRRLQAKHPESRTPGEACEREGIDPREFQTA